MRELTAKDIMKKDVITVPMDMTVHELANLFTEKMISGAPVVNQENKLVGVVSLTDIVRNDDRRVKVVSDNSRTNYYLHGWEDKLTREEMFELHVEENQDLSVKEIMTPLLFQVPETQSLSDLADMMIVGRIHRLFVTKNEQIVGIITTLNMLKAIRDHAVPLTEELA